MVRRWTRSMLAVMALLWCGRAASAAPQVEEIVRATLAGTEPRQIVLSFDADSAGDIHLLNAIRLRLKAEGHALEAQGLLDELAQRWRTDAVLYNLSLAYVDQLPGHNLMKKGLLSTSSVRVADEILARHPNDWMALHIRGLNNLYWPDWFDRARTASVDLARAVEAGQPLLKAQPFEDGVAWSYLALGDAQALLDHHAEARSAWREGAAAYPYFGAFAGRIALGDSAQHGAVRAERDSDKPVDTDLEHLSSVSTPGQTVTLTGGTLYGPGPLDDQPLSPGGLHELRLARALTGSIAQMNNGAALPYLPGEVAVGKVPTGLFSDGTPANKNVDVGHVILMNGKFKLFLAALDGGPNHGVIHMYMDRFWNWTIQDDIGIDPGFREGVIKFNNFMFSTSPRLLPESTQTQSKEPGGVDRAGSLASQAWVVGLLGDDLDEGKLSGTFNAIGSFPLGSVFLPGAPFAQTRVFRTDIAISQEIAGFLTLANAISYLRAADAESAMEMRGDADRLEQVFRDRLVLATHHFDKADGWRRALDGEAGAAYARLTGPAGDFNEPGVRTRFICAANHDLALLAARLTLVNGDADGSRLGQLMKCEAR